MRNLDVAGTLLGEKVARVRLVRVQLAYAARRFQHLRRIRECAQMHTCI